LTNAAPVEVVNFGTTRRRKSPWRDGQFFEALWASRHSDASAGLAGTSVTNPTSLPPPIPPKFQRYLKRYQEPLAGKLKRTPAEWRDVGPWLRTTYWHHAARDLGTTHAFTLQLRHDVEELARNQPSAASWLQKRIGRALSSALGRRVDHWLILENVRTGRGLHLHGELVVSADEVVAARKALRKAAGEWLTVRQHQAHTQLDPDEAWIGYVMKANMWTNGRDAITKTSRGFSGENHAATQGIRSAAGNLYRSDRANVLAASRAT